MKGKTAFTEREVKEIRKLIELKCQSSSKEQVNIRNKIRKIGFYYSDFSSKKGYTVDDFNYLIELGKISIV